MMKMGQGKTARKNWHEFSVYGWVFLGILLSPA